MISTTSDFGSDISPLSSLEEVLGEERLARGRRAGGSVGEPPREGRLALPPQALRGLYHMLWRVQGGTQHAGA